MVAGKLASWSIAAAALFASAVHASVDPIVIQGSKFFYKTNGSQFFIRGVDYQQNPNMDSVTTATINDPLADSAGCTRDLPYLLKLRTNTIRVYAIDPTQSHDSCMNLFASNGIYVIADLSSPTLSINREDPAWTIDLYNRYTSVIDLMAGYTNTLGFFAGNEVANMVNNTDSLPFVRAAIRDMKSYISSKNYRAIGVGYAATDDATIREGVRPYMDCGDKSSSVDFFGYNIYEWCNADDTYITSGYQARTEEFRNYSVPVFFAEYGCNTNPPRTFRDTPVLFEPPMSDVWSGGLVYEYFQDVNDFGLVSIVNSQVQTLTDFATYSTEVAKVNPSLLTASAYTPSYTAQQTCPTVGASWNASTVLPPSPNADLCNCAVANASCIAVTNVSTTYYASLFAQICAQPGVCDGITGDGSTGIYGAYSMCSAAQRLSIAINNYYINSGSNSQACDFAGNATTQTASLSGSCSSSLSVAGGAAGTGTSTAGASGGSSSSGASVNAMPPFDFGILIVGIYSVVATVAGAGLFFL